MTISPPIIQFLKNFQVESRPKKLFSPWSASDRPVSPYNSGTEAQIKSPQAPEDRSR